MTVSDRIDRVLLNPFLGVIVFLALMYAMFQATTVLAGPAQDWVDGTVREWLTAGVDWVFNLFGPHTVDGWFHSLVVDGLIDGIVTIGTFIPPMGIMFICLSLLEDSGYLARAAFVMDRAMRCMHLDGRAFLPIVIGFGCNLPALAATRTLPDSRQRVMVGMLVPFSSCTARLSVYMVLAYAFFREQAGLLREPSIITGMLIFLFGVGSVYVFYGYVTPYLEQVLGMGTVQASTTLMAYGVFCLVSNILGGWIDARFGMKALLVTFVLQAAALLGLFAVGDTMPLALVFVFSLALLMYLFSVSCITHFMDVARSRHPKSMVLASSVEPMAFNVGISFGTAVGGAVVSSVGIAYVGAVGAAFSLVAWALTLVTIKLARWERKRARA